MSSTSTMLTKLTDRQAKNLLSKLHPNIWKMWREMYETTGELSLYFGWRKLKYKKLDKLFCEEYIQWIKQHLDAGKELSMCRNASHPAGRDLSVSIEKDKNGNLVAYFNSEYPGYGNGDYYYLINETTALYCETD